MGETVEIPISDADVDQSKRWKFALLLLILLLSILFSYVSILRHFRFESRDFDLGVLSNVIFNTSKGKLLYSSYYDGSFLGVHVVPLYLLISVFYIVIPRPEFLLVMQSFAVFFAAIPLFLIGRALKLSHVYSFLLSVAYLFNAGNHQALLYDFHEIAFLPMFLFILSLCWIRDSKIGVAISLALCLSVKEDAAIFVIACLPILISWRRSYPVWTIFSVCIAWYLVTILVRFYFGGDSYPFAWYYSDLIPPGRSGPSGIIVGILSDPLYFLISRISWDRLHYLLVMLGSVGFAPLLSIAGAISVFPGYMMNLMASNEKRELFSLSFQYVWNVIPGSFLTLLFVVNRLKDSPYAFLRRYSLITVVLALCFSWKFGVFALSTPEFKGGYRPVTLEYGPEQKMDNEAFQTLANLIPPEDWVVCSSETCPHLHRFSNVVPCRMWYHERQKFVRWVIGTSDKNCSEKALARERFDLEAQNGPFRLWKRVS